MPINKSISKLTSILADKHCQRLNFGSIKGYIGELLIKQKLEQENLIVEHKGNQSGYDLFIEESNTKIDVKLSMLKDENVIGLKYYGWALQPQSKKTITCTHFICVGVNHIFQPEFYVVIPVKNLKHFPKCTIKRFKNVEKGLVLIKEPSGSALIKNIPAYEVRSYFEDSYKLVKSGMAKLILPSDRLSDFL